MDLWKLKKNAKISCIRYHKHWQEEVKTYLMHLLPLHENIVCLLLPLGIGTCCSASHAMQDLQAWEPISKSCIQFLEYDKQKCLKCPWNKEGIQGEKEKNKKGRRKWKLTSHAYYLHNENIVCLLLLLGTRACCSASLTMQVLAWEPMSKSCM